MDGEGTEAVVGNVEEELEDELSDSKLVDYEYEPKGDSNSEDKSKEEEESRDVGEEEDTTIDGLSALGFAEY